MKKVILTSILMLAILVSCEKDEYDTPYGDFSSFKWYTSTNGQNADYGVNLDEHITFSDVSQNAINHSWSIPVGTSLLNSEFVVSDSIYTPFISENGALTTDEKLINVLFREPGIKEVVLQNVFKDSVTNAVQEGGNWKVEEIFTIEVFDNIKPAFKVMQGDVEVISISENDLPDATDASSWPTVSVEAGNPLTFIDMTVIGQPNSRTWTFTGGNIDTSGSASTDVFYNALGNFAAGSILSTRGNPNGQAAKLIPLNIEVVPSTQPFLITNNLTEDVSEVISFNVSGEVVSVSFGEENNFAISVVNTTSGFNQDIPVESVNINSDDATQIDLVLSAPIFNSDDIMITYAGNGIESVDFRILDSFGPEPVEMFFEGSMNIPGFTGYETEWSGAGNQFKKANTEGFWGQHNANNAGGTLYYWRDTSMAYEGNSSMKFETSATGIPFNARLQGGSLPTLSPVTAGTYVPSVWIFIEPGNTMNLVDYTFNGPGIILPFDISTTPRGEWVNLRLPEIVLPDINSGRLDIDIRNATQGDAIVQKLWIDNFDLLIAEPR